MIALACLLPGEFNRRGQMKRVLLAIGIAFAYQALDVGIKNLAGRTVGAVPAMYISALLPFILGSVILFRGGIRLGTRRGRLVEIPAR